MESTELERQVLQGEIVEVTLEDLASEWASAASKVIWAQLRQARAAAMAKEIIGKGWAKEFASMVEVGKTTVYNFARAWWVHGHRVESGDPSFSARLESGRITMSHLIESTYAPDPMKALDDAEDNNLSSRALEARVREEKQNEAEEEFGKPEVIETMTCPHCGGLGEVPIG